MEIGRGAVALGHGAAAWQAWPPPQSSPNPASNLAYNAAGRSERTVC